MTVVVFFTYIRRARRGLDPGGGGERRNLRVVGDRHALERARVQDERSGRIPLGDLVGAMISTISHRSIGADMTGLVSTARLIDGHLWHVPAHGVRRQRA